VDILRVVSVADTVIALVPIVDLGQILWKRLAAVAQPDSVHGWDRPFWVIRYWNREAAAIEGATAKRERRVSISLTPNEILVSRLPTPSLE
jgi:hypothetical protein